MPRFTGVREVWTFFGGFAVCLGLLVLGPILAHAILDQEGAGTGMRALGVAVGVLALVPWFPFIVWLFRRSDEFERHSMLVGLAVAYGITFIGLAAVDYLGIAGFITWGTLPPAWQLSIFGWGIARIAAAILQRRAR